MSASVSQRQVFDFLNRFHFCLSSPFSLSLLLYPRLSVLHTSAVSFQFFFHMTKTHHESIPWPSEAKYRRLRL